MLSLFSAQYRFNPETLSYDKVEFTTREKIAKVAGGLTFFATGVFLIAFLVFSYFFDSTSYRTMQREKKQLLTQYNILLGRFDQANKVLEDIQDRDDNIYRMVLNEEPLNPAIRNAGIGGVDRYEKLKGFENSNLLIEASKKMDELSKKIVVQSQSFDKVINLANEHAAMLTCIPAIMPISLTKAHITSTFGYRIHPILRRLKMHTGVDFGAPKGTPVYATADGEIEDSKYSGGYGRQITIDHGFGYKTRYAHLNKMLVRNGQKVKRGDLIGEVGNTGLSTASHLHYEVLHKGTIVDPVDYYFSDVDPMTYNKMKK